MVKDKQLVPGAALINSTVCFLSVVLPTIHIISNLLCGYLTHFQPHHKDMCPASLKWWPRQSDVLPPTVVTIWWKGHHLITHLVCAWDSTAIDYFFILADEQYMSKNTNLLSFPIKKKNQPQWRSVCGLWTTSRCFMEVHLSSSNNEAFTFPQAAMLPDSCWLGQITQGFL